MGRIKFDQVMEIFDKLYKEYANCRIDSSERPLYFLLLEYRNKMPPLETQDDYEDFHKQFRQVDVVNENIDMVIYHLLSNSQMFWCACEEVFNNKDADDLFFENWTTGKREERREQRERREKRKIKEEDDA